MLTGLSMCGAGWEANRQFWVDVLPHLGCGAPIVSNTSVVAYVQDWSLGRVSLGRDAPATLPQAACGASRCVALAIYAAGLLLLYARRNDGDCLRDLSIAILLGFLVSPISWWHHYTVALLPFLYLSNMPRPGARRLLLALFAAVATNLAGFGLMFAGSPAAQLALAGVVPGLLLAVIAATLLRSGVSVCVPAAAPPR